MIAMSGAEGAIPVSEKNVGKKHGARTVDKRKCSTTFARDGGDVAARLQRRGGNLIGGGGGGVAGGTTQQAELVAGNVASSPGLYNGGGGSGSFVGSATIGPSGFGGGSMVFSNDILRSTVSDHYSSKVADVLGGASFGGPTMPASHALRRQQAEAEAKQREKARSESIVRAAQQVLENIAGSPGLGFPRRTSSSGDELVGHRTERKAERESSRGGSPSKPTELRPAEAEIMMRGPVVPPPFEPPAQGEEVEELLRPISGSSVLAGTARRRGTVEGEGGPLRRSSSSRPMSVEGRPIVRVTATDPRAAEELPGRSDQGASTTTTTPQGAAAASPGASSSRAVSKEHNVGGGVGAPANVARGVPSNVSLNSTSASALSNSSSSFGGGVFSPMGGGGRPSSRPSSSRLFERVMRDIRREAPDLLATSSPDDDEHPPPRTRPVLPRAVVPLAQNPLLRESSDDNCSPENFSQRTAPRLAGAGAPAPTTGTGDLHQTSERGGAVEELPRRGNHEEKPWTASSNSLKSEASSKSSVDGEVFIRLLDNFTPSQFYIFPISRT